MTTVANASVVFKDKNGNVGTVKGASANDITKISNAISDVAQVVNPTTHLPINATTSSVGVVQLADSTAVSAGTSGRVVDAAQLKAVSDAIPSLSNVVDLSSAQTITGVKTFSSLPESSVAPTTNNQLANKKYVDDSIPSLANVVDLSSAQTITGVKTFSTLPQSSVTPTSNDDLVNKAYVDAQSGGGGLGDYVPGQIIMSSIPQTDARLHLADGSLLSGTGTYAEFVSYMAALYADDPTNACFTTEANWQSSLSTYGVCGKYVYNSTNNTLRIPKITGFVEGNITPAQQGNVTAAGLPNITGTVNGTTDSGNAALFNTGAGGAFSVSGTNKAPNPSTTNAPRYSLLSFDASRSSSIYGNSATVQPQSIKQYFYIVIGTVTKTQIQVDIDQIASDLNLKAGTDLANVNNSGTSVIAHNAMPSDTYDTLTVGASGTTYTAPADGYVYVVGNNATGGTWSFVDLMATQGVYSRCMTTAGAYAMRIFIPIRKGQQFIFSYTNANNLQLFFRYAIGSAHERA